VFLSSGGTVYGRAQELPIPESHPTAPICSHGLTKLIIEKYLGLFRQMHGMEFAVLRCGNAYGEGQDPAGRLGAVSVFLGRVATGREITIWGDGTVVRDFVHVSDVAAACFAAATSHHPDLTVNIGSGQPLSVASLVTRIEQATMCPVAVRWCAARNMDVPAVVLRITLAESALGWRPRVSIDEGLSRTWNWLKSLPHTHQRIAASGEAVVR
jgi:UDP-glucose 4-epimerase